MSNIIITGGELFNKGAQAMLFITVDEMKKRFPNHEIYVLSEMDLRRTKEEKDIYAFKFTGWYPLKFAKAQTKPILRLICKLKNREEFRTCENLYRNCDLMVDISGYGLGSNWNLNQLSTYVDHLQYAQAFNIPYYLMPQSFGPFDFEGKKKIYSEKLPNLLKSVKAICARESDGYNKLVTMYGLTNVYHMTDLVLNNTGIELSNIYSSIPVIKKISIEENSVGIIPNGMTVEESNYYYILDLFKASISQLIDDGYKVYLISHATHDRNLCMDIKRLFEDDNRVIFLDFDFSCLEFNELVKQFKFIIASRFHSIVHAFKNNIPCVSLGWAVKYQELLSEFGQQQYVFDVRKGVSEDDFKKAICLLESNLENEKIKIKTHLEEVQKSNVFDIISI